jgi:putative nucleotidyltransferase with HDIG domain
MNTVLFVDDEPNILDGLRRLLFPLRHEWHMAFAGSGAEALEVLGRSVVDVVVSDLRMPGMDGVQLLTEVAQKYPHIVRITLSGHADSEVTLRRIGLAHQSLSKPCDADILRATITRALGLRKFLSDEPLQDLLSRLPALPTLPAHYARLLGELDSPTASPSTIGELIAQDIGLTAKVLQFVNSALLAFRRHIVDPAECVQLVGVKTIKALALLLRVFAAVEGANAESGVFTALWNHSVLTSRTARQIASAERLTGEVAEAGMVAGLLHDVGKIILAVSLPAQYRQVTALAKRDGTSWCDAELEVFRASHASVGAYLLALWGLPDAIVEAVAYHHVPRQCAQPGVTAVLVVHVADAIAHETDAEDRTPADTHLDGELLSELGLTARLDAWKAAALAATARGACV